MLTENEALERAMTEFRLNYQKQPEWLRREVEDFNRRQRWKRIRDAIAYATAAILISALAINFFVAVTQ